MFRIKIILFVILVALASAQDDYIERPVTFTFFPPLSTNGVEFWNVRTKFSFSIIGGAVGRLEGFELASVFNIEKEVKGFQASGVLNLIHGSFEGLQITGGVNIVGEESKGLQIAPVNIAKSVKGFQLGVVNISDNMQGEAVGLVTITKNGQFHLNLWADEVTPYNIGFKLGTKRIYTIYGFSMKPSGDSIYLIATTGLGWHQPLNNFFMNFEATFSPMRRGFNFRNWESTILNRLKIIGGWQVIPKLAIMAGPTFNYFVSETRDGSDLPIFDATIYSTKSGDNWIRIWPGFIAGIQIF